MAVKDALPAEKGGAVQLECQDCGKEWPRPAGAGSSSMRGS
jgi:hypothetical protein